MCIRDRDYFTCPSVWIRHNDGWRIYGRTQSAHKQTDDGQMGGLSPSKVSVLLKHPENLTDSECKTDIDLSVSGHELFILLLFFSFIISFFALIVFSFDINFRNYKHCPKVGLSKVSIIWKKVSIPNVICVILFFHMKRLTLIIINFEL